MNSSSEVKSPCINICELNTAQICEGCWRHIDEIVEWSGLDAAQRQQVIVRAKHRQAQHHDKN